MKRTTTVNFALIIYEREKGVKVRKDVRNEGKEKGESKGGRGEGRGQGVK